ncbi:uncharacterized protein LOC106090008 [Stomoxys calcitrans]|uniref:uncharacterized protein LOC106090008 n=1 Tax=Stomoxys calcitrans TaxID=35570 RepID=UPI0027E367F5|nr:uncharacterized protein LOC106090008 [Stomoxys calcitrans]
MNYRRVLRVTSGYLLWTTYQLRGLDPKSLRFRLSLWSILHFIIVALIYAVSFGHHFERSSLLKIALDLSPFLKNLMILHIWLGLKVFIFCIIEWRSLTGVLNGLVAVLTMKPESEEGSPRNDWRNELLTYLLFFITLTVAFGFGLYIAIEMDFELPPADHIMIALALFIPHFMLAGSLRLHNLSIWLIRHELAGLQLKLGLTTVEDKQPVVVEIINPVLKSNEGAVEMATNIPSEAVTLETYDKVLKTIQAIANYLKSWNGILQRQMFVLNGLNFNCLLYGIFTRIYFEKTWHLVFIGRNRRVFYAANYVIFACISMDYHLLIIIQMLFDRMVSICC